MPPDLHDLIRRHGAYSKIPPDAWRCFDHAMREWQADVRAGIYHQDDQTSLGFYGLTAEEIEEALNDQQPQEQKGADA